MKSRVLVPVSMVNPAMELIRINSGYFSAGLELRDKTVIRAAPILHYMKGWREERVMGYCVKKCWEFTHL